MGDVVNLKRFKKRTEREQSAKQAERQPGAVWPHQIRTRTATSSAAIAPTICWISIASTAETRHEIARRRNARSWSPATRPASASKRRSGTA